MKEKGKLKDDSLLFKMSKSFKEELQARVKLSSCNNMTEYITRRLEQLWKREDRIINLEVYHEPEK